MVAATWARTKAMSARPFSVAVDGATLSGEIRGDRPALAFLHGFGGDRRTWDAVVAALPDDMPLLRHDQRGFGGSAQDESAPFSHADDMAALLDALEIDRISLVGLSQGGAIAANFAIDHPDRVDRLVLIAPALMGWEWSDDWRRHWRAMVTAARGGDMAQARSLWWEHPLFACCREGAPGAALQHEMAQFAGRQWINDPQHRVLPDIERLHCIQAPTLLLTGGHDLPDFHLIADLLTAAVPDIRRIDYPDAGHMLPLEQPSRIAAEIAAFCAVR